MKRISIKRNVRRYFGFVILCAGIVGVAPIVAADPMATVAPVLACQVLTQDEIRTIYPTKKFSVESENNYPPTPYEALSACRYYEAEIELPSRYHISVEVRAMPSPAEALRFINGRIEMDYDKKGKVVAGIGDSAYLTMVSMAYGGPTLEVVRGAVYYKLNLQTIMRGAAATLEKELLELGKLL